MTVVGDVKFRMGLDRTGLKRDLNRAEGDVKRAARGMRTALASVGGGLALGASIRLLAEFEQSMSTVKAVTGATEAQFKALTAQAKAMGIQTRFSASQAAEGMLALARAGLSVEETIAALPHTLQLAQAGALALGDAADIVTNVMSGMRLEVDQLQRVGDVLTQVANSSNTNVQELGQAFSYAAPIANQFGLSVEETAAALGLFSNNGIKADRAGTALNNVLARLTNRTQKGEKILAKYNLTYEQLDVSQRGLVPVLKTLEKANIGVADSMALFAIRGSAGGNILAKQRDGFIALAEGAENARGVMARTSAIMDDNLNGALLRLRSAVEGLVINLGEDKGLGKVVDTLAAGVRFAADNLDVFGAIAGALAISTLPGVIAGMGKLAIAIRGVMLALGPIPAALAAASAAAVIFTSIGDKAEQAGFDLDDFNEAMDETDRLLNRVNNREVIDVFKILGDDAKTAKDKVDELAGAMRELFFNEYTAQGARIQQEIRELTDIIEDENARQERFRAKGERDGLTGRDRETIRKSAEAEADAVRRRKRLERDYNELVEAGAKVLEERIKFGKDEEESTADRVAREKEIADALELQLQKKREIRAEDIDAKRRENESSSLSAQGFGFGEEEVFGGANPPAAESADTFGTGAFAEEANARAEAMTEALEERKQRFRDTFKSAFKTGIIDGDVGTAIKTIFAEKAADGLDKALDRMADKLFAIFDNIDFGGGGGIGNIFGGLGGLFGAPKANASGGSVSAGRATRVGELGEETFVPFKDGTIIPNKLPTTRAQPEKMQGRAIQVNNTVNVQGDATEATANLINERMRALPDMIDARVNDRKRRGAF